MRHHTTPFSHVALRRFVPLGGARIATGFVALFAVGGALTTGTLLSGCGGSGTKTVTRAEKRGTVSLAVIWPDPSAGETRRIPLNAKSLRAVLRRLDGYSNTDPEQTITRPQTVVDFDGATFPYDSYVLEVSALAPKLDADGAPVAGAPPVIVATASVPVAIDSDSENVTVTLAENVKVLHITQTRTDLPQFDQFYDENREYRVTGYTEFVDNNDPDDDIVAPFPVGSQIIWKSENTNRFRVGTATNTADYPVLVGGTGNNTTGEPITVFGRQSTARATVNLSATYDDKTQATVATARGVRIRPRISNLVVAKATLDQDEGTTISATVLGGQSTAVLLQITHNNEDTTSRLVTGSSPAFYYTTSLLQNPAPITGAFTAPGANTGQITFFAPRQSIVGTYTDISTPLTSQAPTLPDLKADFVAEGAYTVTAWPQEDDPSNAVTVAGLVHVNPITITATTTPAPVGGVTTVTLGNTVSLQATVGGIVDQATTPPNPPNNGRAGVRWETVTDATGNTAVGDASSGTITNPVTAKNGDTATYTPPKKIGTYYVRATSRTDNRKRVVLRIDVPKGDVKAIIK